MGKAVGHQLSAIRKDKLSGTQEFDQEKAGSAADVQRIGSWQGIPMAGHTLSEKTFVLIMIANPEPSYRFSVEYAQSSVPKRDTGGPYVFRFVDTFEMQ